jgi:hypothetical protein
MSTAMKNHVVVFWVIAMCDTISEYHRHDKGDCNKYVVPFVYFSKNCLSQNYGIKLTKEFHGTESTLRS